MKKMFLAGFAMLFIAAAISYAQPMEPTTEPVIKGTLDLSFTSKYVWRGFNVFGSKSAIHPSIDLFSPDTNIGFNLTVHRANSDGYETFERWDYNLYYLVKLFAGEPTEVDFRFGYVYYNFPQQSSHTRGGHPAYLGDPNFSLDDGTYDLQEVHMIVILPKILQIDGLVPSYALVKLWPSNEGTVVGAYSPTGGTASGFAHIFMLDYALPYVCPFTGIDRKLNLHSEFVYNDGVSPTGSNVDHDWSNAVFGATTSYELLDNLFLTPGFFYQSTWDKSVNPNGDEYWGSLSLSYKF